MYPARVACYNRGVENNLINVKQAAQLYGCSGANIRRLVSEGKLRRYPSTYALTLVDAAEVEALSQANREKRESSRPNPVLQAKRKQLQGNSRSAAQLRRRARERRERAELAKQGDIV